MSLTRLTDWESGQPVYLDCSKIVSMRDLVANKDNSRRTRIDTPTDLLLVREPADDILIAATYDAMRSDETVDIGKWPAKFRGLMKSFVEECAAAKGVDDAETKDTTNG